VNDFHGTVDEAQRYLTTLQQTLREHELVLARLQAENAYRERLLLEIQEAQRQQPEPAAPLPSPASPPHAAVGDADYKLALALTLANAAYDALLVVDGEYRIIAINDSAETLFNVQRPIGLLLSDVTGVPELDMMVMDALANQEETFEEQVTIGKRSYRVRSKVIRRAGNLFIGLALQDVSELVRLNRARRDMVANISHELRTPIANIRLIIESLFHDQDRPKRKQSTSALKAIGRETESLIWLVQELLDLSMIESGQAILRLFEQPLAQLVETAIERLEDQSAAKQIGMINEIPPLMQVLVDADHIQRVLINLMHNAIKWSPPGEVIRVRAHEQGDEVIISVLDNGPGVPEPHRERIFERFYQVDPARSGKEGTGLGLAICRHVVEAHGGRIWVEVNPDRADGAGGCFRFTLPLAEPLTEQPEPYSPDIPF
jgi:two-component system phosphate regulon sensor histidine kinase PhoR